MSTIAGLDSPIGENEQQAGQPHCSGPVVPRRLTLAELDTIRVIDFSDQVSRTNEGNGAGVLEDGFAIGDVTGPSPLPPNLF